VATSEDMPGSRERSVSVGIPTSITRLVVNTLETLFSARLIGKSELLSTFLLGSVFSSLRRLLANFRFVTFSCQLRDINIDLDIIRNKYSPKIFQQSPVTRIKAVELHPMPVTFVWRVLPLSYSCW